MGGEVFREKDQIVCGSKGLLGNTGLLNILITFPKWKDLLSLLSPSSHQLTIFKIHRNKTCAAFKSFHSFFYSLINAIVFFLLEYLTFTPWLTFMYLCHHMSTGAKSWWSISQQKPLNYSFPPLWVQQTGQLLNPRTIFMEHETFQQFT